MARFPVSGRTGAFFAAAVFAAGMFAFSLVKEPPLGSLEGRIVAADTGRALPNAEISLIRIGSSESNEKLITSKDDGTFKLTTLAAGDYKIRIDTPAHTLPSTGVTIEEGKTTQFDAELAPKASFMNLVVHQHVYTPKERPQIACRGFTQADSVQLSIYRADMDVLLKEYGGDLARMMNPKREYTWPPTQNYTPESNSALKLVRTASQPVSQRDIEGIYYQRIPIDTLAPGMYVVKAQADRVEKLDWLMVTDLALVAKQAGMSLLTFTADIESGKPVSGVTVEAYEGKNLIGSATSSDSGLAFQTLKPSAGPESNRMIIARRGDSTAFTSSYIYQQEGRKARTIYAYTDRPVYRPGQKVYYKGIVRAFDTDRYTTPEPEQVEVQVQDRFGNLLEKRKTATNRFGSYFGSFTLPKGAATGYYSVTATVAGVQNESGFEVAEYKKPEFSAEVTPLKKRYTRGEQVVFRVTAGYYFGSPLPHATVKYSVTRNPYWFSPDTEEYDEGYEDYEDYGGYGEEVESGEVRTNAQGIAYIKFPARWDTPEGEEDFDSDQEYSVNVSITDASRREAYADASVIATMGEFALLTDPVTYVVSPGEKASVKIRTVNYNGKPRPGVRLTFSEGQQVWKGNDVRFIQEQQKDITTDRNGNALISFKPRKAGQYKLICEAGDEKGNTIRSSAYIWSTSEEDKEFNYKYPELEVVPDRKVYEPGDTAKLLINSERTGVTALVTIEGEKLFDYKLVELNGKSTTIEVPITRDYRPNVSISVGYIYDKQFIQRDKQVRVTLKEQKLNVFVKPDKKKYLPGDTAIYSIKVTDSEGRPVESEVSMGLVDEAVYAIRPDNTRPLLDYFYRRQENNVRTDFSFPQIYLSEADKSGFSGKVRKDFRDTAYWSPSIITDSSGQAKVSVKLPDNLTTWRATLKAVTADTRVGETTVKSVCTKDLLVRLETPRFITQKDSTQIQGIVHNYTDKPQNVTVSFRCSGVRVGSRTDSKVRVDAGGSKELTWDVEAPRSGKAELAAYAQAGKLTDAVKLSIPVRPHGQERIEGSAGVTQAGKTALWRLNLRPDSIAEATSLNIRMTPSLAGTLIGSLDYLADYPYGCTEQTMSRFLPDVVVYQTLKDLGITNRSLEQKIPNMVNTGLLKLYAFQHEDGGWGWYEYDRTDEWMTAYVVYGLLTARKAGFQVNEDILSRGIDALRQRSLNRTRNARQAADTFNLYTLSLVGPDGNLQKRVMAVYNRRERLTDQGLAYLALTLQNLGKKEEANAALDTMFKRADESPAFVFWPADSEYSEMAVETSGAALMAVMNIRPNDPKAPKIVNWLMKQRVGGHWVSTKDTAAAIYGLTQYLKKTKELSPDILAEVFCNGKQAGAVKLDRGSLFAPERIIGINSRMLKKGTNRIEIRTYGSGNLYYTYKFSQYVSREDMPATLTGSGIQVKREYFRLIPKWNDELQTTSLVPAPHPADRFGGGETIRVRLTITSPKRYNYVLIDDMLPAGCEAVDRGKKSPWEWRNWWAAEEIRDDRVSFYADALPQGKRVIEYEIRSVTPGEYHVLPCELYSMYDPSIRAMSAEMRIHLR